MTSFVRVKGGTDNEGRDYYHYNLETKYGRERRCIGDFWVAVEMVRLDALVEEAGIKPGDEIEILMLVEDGEEGRKVDWFPSLDDVFAAVDNGRFLWRTKDSGPQGHEFAGVALKNILGVRKAQAKETV